MERATRGIIPRHTVAVVIYVFVISTEVERSLAIDFFIKSGSLRAGKPKPLVEMTFYLSFRLYAVREWTKWTGAEKSPKEKHLCVTSGWDVSAPLTLRSTWQYTNCHPTFMECVAKDPMWRSTTMFIRLRCLHSANAPDFVKATWQ